MELTPEQAAERLASPKNLANRLEEFRAGRKLPLDDVFERMKSERDSENEPREGDPRPADPVVAPDDPAGESDVRENGGPEPDVEPADVQGVRPGDAGARKTNRFGTADGYTLKREAKLIWTDGDLVFEDRFGIPVDCYGEPLDGVFLPEDK